MFDMVKLLACLSEGQHVLIPGFCKFINEGLENMTDRLFVDDAVQKKTDKERELYKLLSSLTGQPAETFSQKWIEPSLSLHSLEVSGPGSTCRFHFSVYTLTDLPSDATVIPAKVIAKISLRIVPNQDLRTITKSLQDHLAHSFQNIKSPNKLSVIIPPKRLILSRIDSVCRST